MSHLPVECPAVREQGHHHWSSWTTELRAGTPMLWRKCFECLQEEWEFEPPVEHGTESDITVESDEIQTGDG